MPLEPGEVAELAFGMHPTSVLFQEGHRIRIAIAGHDASALRGSQLREPLNSACRGTPHSPPSSSFLWFGTPSWRRWNRALASGLLLACRTSDPDNLMRLNIGSILVLSAFALTACGSQGGTPSLETEDQIGSYGIGFQTGMQLVPAKAHIDLEAYQAGVRDAMSGAEPVIPRNELQTAIQTLSETVNVEEGERLTVLAQRNEIEGAAFFAENQGKGGIVTTESGLQYEVLREGDGPRPGISDRVSLHYKGTLLDGTQFDSSYEGGEPVAFGVSAVIPGFSEGLQLMTVGSHYRLFIPSSLAYGPQGSPPLIGPNATLVFEIEMLGIVEEDPSG